VIWCRPAQRSAQRKGRPFDLRFQRSACCWPVASGPPEALRWGLECRRNWAFGQPGGRARGDRHLSPGGTGRSGRPGTFVGSTRCQWVRKRLWSEESWDRYGPDRAGNWIRWRRCWRRPRPRHKFCCTVAAKPSKARPPQLSSPMSRGQEHGRTGPEKISRRQGNHHHAAGAVPAFRVSARAKTMLGQGVLLACCHPSARGSPWSGPKGVFGGGALLRPQHGPGGTQTGARWGACGPGARQLNGRTALESARAGGRSCPGPG